MTRIAPSLTQLLAIAATLIVCQASRAQVGGVFIDAKGLLNDSAKLTPEERLRVFGQNPLPAGSPAVATGNSTRRVSLKRLQATLRQHHEAGAPSPAEAKFLAGLVDIEFLVFDPDERDVILIGPAENWRRSETGEVVGTKTGRPILQLDDFIEGLRFAFAEKPVAPFIGCSIDPTPDGLQRHATFVRGLRGMDRTRLPQIFAGMEQAMGMQQIRVFGVRQDSPFAMKLVAADYRLKRIAMGHDPAPVRGFTNFLDLKARRFKGGVQPQHRWWLVPEFDAINHSPDGLAFEFVGAGLKVQTAPTSAGAAAASPTAKQFSEATTKLLPQIAQKLPIFAEVQNLALLSVVAELIAQKAFDPKAAQQTWDPDYFLDAEKCKTPSVA
ncbi:MAG: DUF1598 domain-containing protein, partial [Planctomycetota bacterium]|nr:DUF1598 domain-containing protein [Planctomycetota bacterium]